MLFSLSGSGRCMLFSLSGSGRCMLFSLSGSGPLLPAFRPSQDAGGDVCCSPCLGLGDVCCSPCLGLGDACCSPYLGLGLYYLLSGLRRMLGEMYAVLLVWVWAYTTCFQAFAGCWGRCMLFSFSGSGPILPAFRPSQDAGGDVCCSPFLGLGLYYLLSGLRRMLGEMYAVLLF